MSDLERIPRTSGFRLLLGEFCEGHLSISAFGGERDRVSQTRTEVVCPRSHIQVMTELGPELPDCYFCVFWVFFL